MGIIYKIAEWIFVIVLIPFILFSDLSKNTEEKYFYKGIKNQFKNNVYEVSLATLTNFEWDKVYYAGPYTGFVEDKIYLSGKYYKISSKTKIDLDDDGQWAFLFIKNNEVTHIVRGKGFYVALIKRKYLIYHSKMKPGIYNSSDTLILDKQNRFYIRRSAK